MTISYFVFFDNKAQPDKRISDTDLQGICELLARTPMLLKAHVFTPAMADGPFKQDGPAPQFGLQLYFPSLETLEAAIGPAGHLQELAAPQAWASLRGAVATQQAMITRSFPVPQPQDTTATGDTRCSYLVHYPGQAQDLNSWHKYYLSHHPQLMQSMPGIREIEIFTRVDWCDSMPWSRVDYMQRNKLVFDNPAALEASLVSPALHEMRADYRKFPPFSGGNVHYPFITLTINP